jgi:hypothetical protein
MAVTIYKDVGFNGLYAHMEPGLYSGQQIRGYNNQSPYESGEFLDNEINSIRVKSGTIAVINSGYSQSATGGRVIIGPKDISDLSSIGMSNTISSIQIVNYRRYDSSRVRHGNVFLYSDYNMGGRRAILGSGDYTKTRLQSNEVSGFDQIRSLSVDAYMIAILYTGNNFEEDEDATIIIGPNSEGDLNRVGIIDRINSIRVYYTDPNIVTSYNSGLNPSNWPSPGPQYNRSNPYPPYKMRSRPRNRLFKSKKSSLSDDYIDDDVDDDIDDDIDDEVGGIPIYTFILVFIMIVFLVLVGFFTLRKVDVNKLMRNHDPSVILTAE